MTTSPPGRPPAQDIDAAQAERLQALRKALSLSVADMAHKLGLWGANGTDNLRQMERGARPLPGTLQVLLGYMERERAGSSMATYLESLKDVKYRSVREAFPELFNSKPLPPLTGPAANNEPDNSHD
jgi:transcriptional regulator with XRE-family HTH domain